MTTPAAPPVASRDRAVTPRHVDLRRLQLVAVATVLGVGLVLWLLGWRGAADVLYGIATVLALVPATVEAIRRLAAREAGVDVIAVLAMAGALLLGEYLAGAIIALMLTGGEALEDHAAGRARRELTALLHRAPRSAHVQTSDGLRDVPIDAVAVGDRLLVKTGEVVPTDGLLRSERAMLDEAALTGEAVPVEVFAGHLVPSGVVNAAGPIEIQATAPAAESTYAGVIALVEQAATERAPFVRLADRYATVFLAITLVVAGVAWIWSGDPIRALAVLVVATPCPLILAAPAAIVGGLSQAARSGIIVKGGGAMESLAGGEVVLLDKTGTITAGQPTLARVHVLADLDATEVLRLAASLDQVSLHPFAPAIVAAATARDCTLSLPVDVHEELGRGISGEVDGVRVTVGTLAHVAPAGPRSPAVRRLQRRSNAEATSLVHVAVEGRLVGALTLHDPIRPDTPRALRALRRAGIAHIVMVTGDRADIAELVAETVGIDRVLAERAPDEKVEAVRDVARLGRTIMVGDGINDAPALALADTGVAMGARGATAASEAADVVLTRDRLDGVADAVSIARRTRRIAWQSVVVGIGLSVVAMGFAAAGHLPPVAGALLQEGIDVAVILNALRALRPPRSMRRRPRTPAPTPHVLAEHRNHARALDELGAVAERLEELPPPEAVVQLRRARDFLADELLPHELEEERVVYPAFIAAAPGEDPTAPLVRSHREIARQIRLFSRLVDDLGHGEEGLDREDLIDLQRALWGLHAVLDLHFTLEDDLYSQLPAAGAGRAQESVR